MVVGGAGGRRPPAGGHRECPPYAQASSQQASNAKTSATSVSSRESDRLVALDRHPVPGPSPRPVVPDRHVLHAAVVPERNAVLLPAEAHLELRLLDVLEEETQDGLALGGRHAGDVRREHRINEESFAA